MRERRLTKVLATVPVAVEATDTEEAPKKPNKTKRYVRRARRDRLLAKLEQERLTEQSQSSSECSC